MKERIHRDPICGGELPVEATTLYCVHGGEIWYFCSRLCEAVFRAFPDQSVEIARQDAAGRRDAGVGKGTPAAPNATRTTRVGDDR